MDISGERWRGQVTELCGGSEQLFGNCSFYKKNSICQ